MKKLIMILLATLLVLSMAACTAEKNDLTSINEYMAPSYDHKIQTGTLTFKDNVGETAIITDYVGLYTSHEVVVPETINDRTVVAIGEGAFYYCTAITTVTLPDTVTVIDDWAFAGCTSLETIVIPASVTSIGKGAFNGCENLKSVIFEGATLTSIGDYAFQDCVALEDITLPASLKSIGTQAFRDCEKLASLTAPEGLETIGNMAFYGWTGLNADGALALSASITEIGEFAFANINKLYITAPEGSYAAEYVAEMKDFEEVETE